MHPVSRISVSRSRSDPDASRRVSSLARPRARFDWLAVIMATCACSPSSHGSDGGALGDAALEAGPDRALLIDHESWERYERSEDPLSFEQPEELECGIAGFFVERGELEVDSARCNYLLAEHPALRAVGEGGKIALEFRHYDLEASEPAQTHIAILFGDQLQWETLIPIPSPAGVIHADFLATAALAKGEPIRLHLHNHGQNTYTFAWLRVVSEPRGDDSAL
jgi:hypothetical protein